MRPKTRRILGNIRRNGLYMATCTSYYRTSATPIARFRCGMPPHYVDLDSVLTYNEASVINSDGIVYDPFDRPPGEEVVEVIPRDRSRSPSRS